MQTSEVQLLRACPTRDPEMFERLSRSGDIVVKKGDKIKVLLPESKKWVEATYCYSSSPTDALHLPNTVRVYIEETDSVRWMKWPDEVNSRYDA